METTVCPGCAERDSLIRALEERLLELEGQVRDLKDQLKPPPPRLHAPQPPAPAKKKTGRRPGGQPGHLPHVRVLLPSERVDHVIDHRPRRCEKCDTALPVEAAPGDPQPIRFQVAELPEVAATITEHQAHARMSRSELLDRMLPAMAEMWTVLRKGCRSRDPKLARFCRRLRSQYACLWTFVKVEGVEPTNNLAERVLRRAVLWRRRSFGCHSVEGCRFVERILTVTQTLRQQKRSIIDFLQRTIESHRERKCLPSLLTQ